MTLDVHQLQRDDFDAFLQLGHIMHQECEPHVTFSDEVLLAYMFKCINAPTRNEINGFVVYRNNKMIGMAIGTAGNGLYTPDVMASLHYWYVLPEYRRTRAAAELLRTFERWAHSIGAARMHLGAERMDTREADAVNHMISKRGFTKYGEQFYKELQTGRG